MLPRDLAPLSLVTIGIALAGCSGLGQVAPPALAQPDSSPAATTRPPAAASTATDTPTSAPSPTPPLHPLSIAFLRDTDFPGSIIPFGEVLSPWANPRR